MFKLTHKVFVMLFFVMVIPTSMEMWRDSLTTLGSTSISPNVDWVDCHDGLQGLHGFMSNYITTCALKTIKAGQKFWSQYNYHLREVMVTL